MEVASPPVPRSGTKNARPSSPPTISWSSRGGARDLRPAAPADGRRIGVQRGAMDNFLRYAAAARAPPRLRARDLDLARTPYVTHD